MFQPRRTYLDFAAAAPPSAAALRTFTQVQATYGNPSSAHAEGREARELLEKARLSIARLAGTKPDAVIFTSGATEANALGIVGHVNARIAAGSTPTDLHVLYLPSAHASVLGAIRSVASLGVEIEPLSVVGGSLDLKQLERQVRPETAIVVVDVVCGETGTIYDIRDVRRVLDRCTASHITLFVDASQAPRVESFELQHLGADLLTLDAQKVGGVRGIGVLIAPRQVSLLPLIQGGGQERGLRPGTESPALARAFATALEECAEHRSSFIEQSARMRGAFLTAISEIPEVEVNEGKEQAPHIVNLSLRGRDTDYLVALLDEAGFAVSTKSACETDETGSRAVLAMTGDRERAAATLRVSWGPTTRESDLLRAADALVRAVRFLDENAI